MIIHSYDDKSDPLIGPGSFGSPRRALCDVCILTFSHLIMEEMHRRFALREVQVIRMANGEMPVYVFEHAGMTIALHLSGIGSALAGTGVVDINWFTGATKFIMFGSAGSLNREVTTGKYVLPTEAYRDEGLSYHYAPPADYITIRNSGFMEAFFRESGLPYVKGRVWSTDAFYRETRNQVLARQKEGCVAVDMELAGVQAVCDYHGFELYDFLVTGDVLDAPEYDVADLHGANHDFDKIRIALDLAHRVQEGVGNHG